MIFTTFRDPEGVCVARITDVARCVAGPYRDASRAWVQAERLAREAADKAGTQWSYSVWPAEYATSHSDYAAELGADAASMARACYIV